jgi:uncharacterized protein
MKPSRYNLLFPLPGGGGLLYNSLSGALSQLDGEKLAEVERWLGRPEQFDPRCTHENPMARSLSQGRFLIEDDTDEMEILRSRALLGKFTPDKLGVTVMPTLDCNLRCVYCFVAHRPVTMSVDTMEDLENWVRVSMRRRRRLEIGWFGGEPLLRMARLTSSFRAAAEAVGAAYTAEMASNGYLLTKERAEELSDLGVFHIQVAIDGTPDVHDRRRPRADGGPSFDTIFANVVTVARLGRPAITVRPVVDTASASSLFGLIDRFVDKGVQGRLTFNPQNAQPSPENDLACLGPHVPTTEEFAVVRADLLLYAAEKGFRVHPIPVLCQACPAHNPNSFIVSPTGELFKCGSFLRPSDRVGRLDRDSPDGASIDPGRLWAWVGDDPFDDPQCRECDVMPICMGGCQALRRQKGKADRHCIYYRYNLERELRAVCSVSGIDAVDALRSRAPSGKPSAHVDRRTAERR